MSEFRRKLMMAYAANLGRGDITYPGLIAAWSAKGKTNDDEDRAILRDLTGNGHDITLNGFAFSEMSGYGGYPFSYSNWVLNTAGWGIADLINNHTVHISEVVMANAGFVRVFGDSFIIPSHRLKITGLTNNNIMKITHQTAVGVITTLKTIEKDGIYEIPEFTAIKDSSYDYYNYIFSQKGPCDITIEILPEYPDALVFDGVDDYGSAVDFGGKSIEFIIAKYQHLSYTIGRSSLYGRLPNNDNWYRINIDRAIDENPYIRVVNTNYTNGTKIDDHASFLSVGDKEIYKTLPFQLTGFDGNKEVANIAFYSAYIFDRVLDEQEIKAFIRKYIDSEYLLPSEIPTPDCYYDFSLGSNDDENRETIKDQSGNGNDAKAYNIAWNDMSGYGGFALLPRKSYVISKVDNSNNLIYKSPKPGTRVVLHISGIPDGAKVISRARVGVHFEASVDGTYIIEDTGDVATIAVTDFTGECNIEITEEPQYPGALVLDGTDDYIALEAFDSGFKTIFMVCNPLNLGNMLYDQRSKLWENYGLQNPIGYVAYSYENENGTYINNVFNTKIMTNELINKKHLISIITNDISASRQPNIGRSIGGNLYAGMAIYKFLGFKDELTEEQIQTIIKKYNLLDGVDEIEVS